jgi:hypothetical protein
MSGDVDEPGCSGNGCSGSRRPVFAHLREQHEPPDRLEAGAARRLTSEQAFEAAFRLVAGYYDYERIAPILQLLEAISWPGDHPDSNGDAWAVWQVCVQRTLDGAPRPQLPPPWA